MLPGNLGGMPADQRADFVFLLVERYAPLRDNRLAFRRKI